MSAGNTDFAKLVLDKYKKICQENDDVRKSSSTTVQEDSFSHSTKSLRDRSSHDQQRKRKHNPSGPFKSITEQEVGITQYINKDGGFKGIIKHRFSDFQVNEIDIDGNIVKLTSLDVPEATAAKDEGEAVLSDVLSEEQWSKIREIAESTDSADTLLINVTEKTKEERGLLHHAIKNAFDSKTVTNTKVVGDDKYIEVMKMIKPETRWPSGKPSYLHATMFKVNLDMTEIIHALGNKLKSKPNLIGFCGTKDKRAKTCQRISVKRRLAQALADVGHQNLVFGNFEYSNDELRLGSLGGNRFRLAIRNVTDSDESVNKSMTSLKENGFINYFGLQRFGFASTPTYVIGKALLSSDWKKAIELILKPRTNMLKQRELCKALNIWSSTRNASEAIKVLNKKDNSIEARILRKFHKDGNLAYMNALFSLPRNTMTMYMHAYQSLVWNKVVSRRLEVYGTKVLAGDLIVVSGSVDEVEFDDEMLEVKDDEQADDEKMNVDCEEDKKTVSNGNKIDEVKDSKEKEEDAKTDGQIKGRRSLIEVRALTEEEAATASLFDVVYPLPGRDVKYPENEMSKWYDEILAEDGFKQEHFTNKHKNFSLGGAYRHIMAKAEDIKWEIIKYKNINDDLILSDLDNIKGVKLQGIGEGDFKGVILEFSLKPCYYATMALRELMKCDTSVFAQATLTQQHAKKPRIDSTEATDPKSLHSSSTDSTDPKPEDTPEKSQDGDRNDPISLVSDFTDDKD